VFLYGYGDRMSSVQFLRDSKKVVPLSALPGASYVSREEEFRHVRAEVESKGYEVLAVDLTASTSPNAAIRSQK